MSKCAPQLPVHTRTSDKWLTNSLPIPCAHIRLLQLLPHLRFPCAFQRSHSFWYDLSRGEMQRKKKTENKNKIRQQPRAIDVGLRAHAFRMENVKYIQMWIWFMLSRGRSRLRICNSSAFTLNSKYTLLITFSCKRKIEYIYYAPSACWERALQQRVPAKPKHRRRVAHMLAAAWIKKEFTFENGEGEKKNHREIYLRLRFIFDFGFCEMVLLCCAARSWVRADTFRF